MTLLAHSRRSKPPNLRLTCAGRSAAARYRSVKIVAVFASAALICAGWHRSSPMLTRRWWCSSASCSVGRSSSRHWKTAGPSRMRESSFCRQVKMNGGHGSHSTGMTNSTPRHCYPQTRAVCRLAKRSASRSAPRNACCAQRWVQICSAVTLPKRSGSPRHSFRLQLRRYICSQIAPLSPRGRCAVPTIS